MKRLAILLCCSFLLTPLLLSQFDAPNRDPLEKPDVKLPNGKSQRDEIAKADHKRNLEDAAKLAQLSLEVKQEFDAGDSHVVSLKTLKKLSEVEKLARTIQGRLKRY